MANKKKPRRTPKDPKLQPESAESPPEPVPADEPESVEDLAKGSSLGQLPRVISLIVLASVVLLTGILFFKVMASFLVPLFLAAVLAVIFEPLHKWSLVKLPERNYWAALLTTSIISILVLAPLTWIGWEAFHEAGALVEAINGGDSSEPTVETPPVALEEPKETETSEDEVSEPAAGYGMGETGAQVEAWIKSNISEEFSIYGLIGYAQGLLARNAVQIGLTSIEMLFGAALGLAIMIFSLYYFFADGPSILKNLMRLSPLEDKYELQLLERFATVSRAVVVATLLSALVQGLLGGIGYWFVLREGSPIFLLTVLTMLLAIVPFLGATAVWAPVAAWVFFLTPDDAGFWPGIGLAVYGFFIVSSVDNVLKPLVLSGQSNLHPLLAMLSVLGGIQFLGPIGILVGPMLVVFMQALLEMLRKEIDDLKKG